MAVIKKENTYMGLPMNIARGNPVPLDKSEIWYSYAEMEAYAKESVVAYVGQIIQLVDETNKTATAYIIANEAGDLIEVGSSTLGDNKTIELTDEGILRIVGADTAETGAQLTMGADGTVQWVKPDTNTVAGLQTTVAQHEKSIRDHEDRLDAAEEDIDALQAKVSSLGSILNFVGTRSVVDFANEKAEDYDVGDVFIVEGKELVCIEETITNDDGSTSQVKRWEPLGDPNGVEALAGRVDALETWKTSTTTSLATLTTKVATAETNISNLTNKDAELAGEIAKKADNDDLVDAVARISANETAITNLQNKDVSLETALNSKASTTYVDGKVTDLQNSINGKADQSALQDVIDNMVTTSALDSALAGKVDVSTYNDRATVVDTKLANVESTANTANSTANTNKSDIADIKETLKTVATTGAVEGLTTRVGNLETKTSTLEGNMNTLAGSITSLNNSKADKTVVEGLASDVADNTAAIAAHAAEYTALEGRVATAEADIVKAQAQADKGVADAASAATAAANAQKAADNAMAKAEEVLGTSNDNADANTVYGAKKAAAEAAAAAETAQQEVDNLEGVVAGLKTSYETADAALDKRLEAVEDVIDGVQGAMHFVGISLTDPSDPDGSVTIDGKPTYEPIDGDVIIYKDADNNSIEYIYSSGAWVELGDVSAEAKRIESLEGRMTSAETAIADLPDIKDDITGLDTALAALEKRVKANEDKNATQDESLANLDARVKANAESITSTAEAIRAELAAEVQARKDAITAEATARATAVNNLQSQITVINNQLTWNKMGSTT